MYFCVIMCVCDRVGACLEPATELGKENFWVEGQSESECVWGWEVSLQTGSTRGESGPEQGKEWRPAWGVQAQAGCRLLLGVEAWAGVRRSSCRGRPTLRCLSSSGAGEIRLRGGRLVREDGA